MKNSIQKIQIENKSSLSITDCLSKVLDLIKKESKFIMSTRKCGSHFTFAKFVISFGPVCKAWPEDTLFIYVHDKG